MMMNCKQTRALLDDYLDGLLEGADRHAVAGHLGDCEACHRELEAEQGLRAALHHLHAPEPAEGFFDQALERAARQAQAQRSRRRGVIVGGALAASFVLVLTAQLLLPGLNVPSTTGPATTPAMARAQAVPDISIALGEVNKVSLAIHAAMNIDQATFVIALPPGTELSGFPGRRVVRWQGRLKQGKNLLELPVVVNEGQGGILEARIEHDGKRSVYRMKMDVKAASRITI